MPWKGETNPYRIWLSEIILQQTRVEQGKAYYEKFILSFPAIQDLARATEKDVFKHWEGLGYYSRCRNLIATARRIVQDYEGQFPSSYTDILALPGIGPYTASAIASFAFSQPHAVVDGNVERVLARYFGISAPTQSAAGKKLYRAVAYDLLDKGQSALFNQAIMDFGATVCKPRNPLCEICVQAKNCQAYQHHWVNILPVKKLLPPRKKRIFYYFLLSSGKDKFWIRERTEKDVWKHLYEFVLWEPGQIIPQNKLKNNSFLLETFGQEDFAIEKISPAFHQTLTHQTITAYFIHISAAKIMTKLEGYQSVSIGNMADFPFPKLINDYLKILISDP